MTKYNLRKIEGSQVLGTFETKQEAADYMLEYITKYNDRMHSSNDYLTPFDFTLDEIECKEINEVVTTYEEAREYLGGKPNADFTVAKKILSGNCVQLEDVARLVSELNPKHVKAIIAFNRLCTIAQALNKEDDFIPDFSNRNQTKWFPWFVYSDDAAGFVCADTYNTAANAGAYIGYRLCFKTRERAMQFGKQFIGLWNQVLLE